MRISTLSVLIAAVASLAATPALAEDAKASPALTVSGGATLVSDYRFRGISQTDRRFAVQGTVTLAHKSGVYASVWGSSIDDYVANGADQEIDLILGVKHSFGDTTLDGGLLYYYYPGSGGIASDFAEPYFSVTQAMGPVSAKALVAYAPRQNGLSIGNGREDNLYLAGDLSYAVPKSPFSLTAHVGRSIGPSYLTIGRAYTDWSLGAAATWHGFTVGLTYVDTDGRFTTPRGRNAAGPGIVGSIGASF
ncbi:TorF family putative porin [Sphingomonas astaxanthinifaciens]|uniref:Exported protein n=1 Tax=Sphingomonas astaxanthinifaciens DSM 22298 TaxID=1123267 RepID=A0ABQ5Z8E7_9SPHN|nr:TorF family putative porin [Sphingomonas astaxanthinifaciens]GLR48270.1 exported protein [Sphingomonas astaxanthinifaciens DSM 22298]